jgi:hypothetical protein
LESFQLIRYSQAAHVLIVHAGLFTLCSSALLSLLTLLARHVIELMFAAMSLILGVTAADLNNSASAEEKFTIQLSGSNEVPPVKTAGKGVAIFQISPDRKSLHYELDLTKKEWRFGSLHSLW